MAELPLDRVEVVTLGDPRARDVTLGGHGLGGGAGQRRRRTPWLVGGVVIAVLVGAVAVGRSGSGDASSAATTTSSSTSPSASSTVVPTPAPIPTVVDGRPRPADASAGMATERPLPGLGPVGGAAATPPPAVPAGGSGPTTTEPAFTQDETFSPFLSSRTGLVAYGLDAEGRLVRVDVDRGSVSRRVLSGLADGARAPILARAAAALLDRTDGTTVVVPDDPDQPEVRIFLGASSWLLPADAPTALWQVQAGPVVIAQRLRLDGSADGPFLSLPASALALGDDGHGNLLFDGIDGTYLVGPGQPTTRVTTGRLLAWSATTFVDAVCTEAYVCHWRVTGRATGEVRDLGRLPDHLAGALAAVVSPDGNRLAVIGADRSLTVTDLTSGEVWALGEASWTTANANGNGLGWSRDGRWLLWSDPDGIMQAWSVGASGPEVVDGLGHIPALTGLTVAV